MVKLNQEGRVDVRVESDQRMELTVSKTSMIVLSRLSETFSSAIQAQLPSRDDNVINVKNSLGFNLKLYLKASGVREKGKSKKIESICLPPNEEIQLTSLNEKVKHLLIDIQVDDSEITRKIDVARNVKNCFDLNAGKRYPSGSSWKWICSVESIDAFSKFVSFQSVVQVKNNFSVPLEVYNVEEKQGKKKT
jgi:hypothetical protein